MSVHSGGLSHIRTGVGIGQLFAFCQSRAERLLTQESRGYLCRHLTYYSRLLIISDFAHVDWTPSVFKNVCRLPLENAAIWFRRLEVATRSVNSVEAGVQADVLDRRANELKNEEAFILMGGCGSWLRHLLNTRDLYTFYVRKVGVPHFIDRSRLGPPRSYRWRAGHPCCRVAIHISFRRKTPHYNMARGLFKHAKGHDYPGVWGLINCLAGRCRPALHPRNCLKPSQSHSDIDKGPQGLSGYISVDSSRSPGGQACTDLAFNLPDATFNVSMYPFQANSSSNPPSSGFCEQLGLERGM